MKLFKLIFFCSFLCSIFAKEVEFIDIAGNSIKINTPVNKIALSFYYTDFLAVSGKDGFNKIIGFSKAIWKDWNPISWQIYLKSMPNLDNIEDFGEANSGNLSIEKIISLNPDVLVVSKMQYDALKDNLQTFKNANIPVIAVDFHKGDFKNHEQSIKIFGILSGNEKRANEIIKEYKNRLIYIQEKTKNIKNKRKVYVEYGHGIENPEEYGLTYSHFMWGALIDKINAINISDGVVNSWGPTSPEKILSSNPDVIFLVGSEWKSNPKSMAMLMGNKISFDEANKRFKPFLTRKGWSELKAVKNGEIFSGDHAMLRTITDIFMLEFVAKATYPELFQDLNPQENYINFYKKYMPIIPDGTFMIKMNEVNF